MTKATTKTENTEEQDAKRKDVNVHAKVVEMRAVPVIDSQLAERIMASADEKKKQLDPGWKERLQQKLDEAHAQIASEDAVVPGDVRYDKDKGGVKYDYGKPRPGLMPPHALLAISELYAIGALKYADRNWEKGMDWSRMFDAMQRHLLKWWGKESEYDPEMGVHHLACVGFYALNLLEYALTNTGNDDRTTLQKVKPSKVEGTIKQGDYKV